MKRRDLVELLHRGGWYLERDDGGHTVFKKKGVKWLIAVPHHREISEMTAKAIRKQAGV